tara:strand:+ start:665 stop:1669 length:1005 start_codon:yes stop_codon:yes gene_type:complete
VVERVVTKLVNSFTGRRFGGGSSGGIDIPDVITSDGASAQAQACAACFSCQIPEARLVWLGIALVFGCVIDGVRFEGEVSSHCLADGEWYHSTLCGPRGVATDALSDKQWRETYAGHRAYEERHLQGLAAAFEQLAEDAGGEGASAEATTAAALAKTWFDRDILSGEDQAAKFIRQTCQTARSLNDEDAFSEYQFLHREGSLGAIAGQLLYESCKRSKMPTCQVDVGRSAIDLSYEVAVCAKSQPACIRNRDVCLGRCDGTEAVSLPSPPLPRPRFSCLRAHAALPFVCTGYAAAARHRDPLGETGIGHPPPVNNGRRTRQRHNQELCGECLLV